MVAIKKTNITNSVRYRDKNEVNFVFINISFLIYYQPYYKERKFFWQYFAKAGGHGILDFMKTRVKQIFLTKQNKVSDCVVSAIFIILALWALYVCIMSGMGDDIWFDEVFSMKFIEYGYGEIATLTAADVHPPFYYWYLKVFHDMGKLLVPGASGVVLAKMASVLPFIGMWIYAFTLIRKRMGIAVSGLFLFFIATMPQISNYTVEIRMYALALFSITALFLHGYEIINGAGKWHWAAFWLYGILTAYTQYYACVAVAAVYIALFVYFIVVKEIKQVMTVGICAILSVIAYLPWIPSFIGQLQNVSNSYWIQPLTFRSIFGCIKFVFLPVSYATTRNYILAVLMIGIFGLAFVYALWKEKDVKVRYLLLSGVFIPVFVAFVGFVCSALNRPIFVYRYLIPAVGAMWLVAAYVLLKYRRELVVLLLMLPFLAAADSNMDGFYAEEHKKLDNMELTEEFLREFPEDAVILCNFNHVQALTAYYLDNENVLYDGEPESLIAKMMPHCVGMPDVTQLETLVQEKDVYFLGSFEIRDELLKEWEKYGISYTEEGTYLLERYWFNVYHLRSENR